MEKLQPGLMMGFEENTLLIGVVDEFFVEEELRALKLHPCSVYYISKGIVDLFLLQIEDSLETSDAPFCVFDWKEDPKFQSWLQQRNPIHIRVVYLDLEGKEIGVRKGRLSDAMSRRIRSNFIEHLQQDFDEEAYQIALKKIQTKYEPFELEAQAEAFCKI